MRVSVRPSVIRSLAVAAAAAVLFGAGSAWAGAGGESIAPLKKILADTCAMLGITSCPDLNTANQLIVEIAALTNTTPSQVRATNLNGIAPAGAVDGGTRGGVATPLAFIAPPNKVDPPIPVKPTDPRANSFISATLSKGTLDLTFDYLPRTISPFPKQEVGDIKLPVAVTDKNGNVQGTPPISANLEIFGGGGACPGPSCVSTRIVADLEGTGTPQTYTDIKDQLGIDFSLDFSGTGGSEVVTLGVPLIGFDDLLSFAAPGFEFDDAKGLFYGIDPVATFLTATFLNDANDPPAINADLAIARDGDTVLSSPGVPEPSTLALLGSGFVWLGLARLRRRRAAA